MIHYCLESTSWRFVTVVRWSVFFFCLSTCCVKKHHHQKNFVVSYFRQWSFHLFLRDLGSYIFDKKSGKTFCSYAGNCVLKNKQRSKNINSKSETVFSHNLLRGSVPSLQFLHASNMLECVASRCFSRISQTATIQAAHNYWFDSYS